MMAKLIGKKKINVAIFASGRGSNLFALIKYSLKKNSKIKINLIVSDNNKSKALRYARNFKIPLLIVNYSTRSTAEKKILKKIKYQKIELICLAGFMKILSKYFIKEFKHPILNIHPSLLPKYKGLKTHERALMNKEKFTGCTVHFVNSKIDDGKIILQKRVKINAKDNVKTLNKKVLNEEHKIYPKAVTKILFNY